MNNFYKIYLKKPKIMSLLDNFAFSIAKILVTSLKQKQDYFIKDPAKQIKK